MSAQVTEAHRELFNEVRIALARDTDGAQLIADSEARAVNHRPSWALVDSYKAERDQLRAEVLKLQEQIGQQLAACDCAAMMDTPETHEKNKTVTRENPFWSNAFESVMRRTAECIALRAEVAQLEKNCTDIYDLMKKAEAETQFFATINASLNIEVERLNASVAEMHTHYGQAHARAEKAEAELSRVKEVADFQEGKALKLSCELAKERARLDWLMGKSFLVMPSAADFSSPMRYAVHVYTPDGDLKQQYPDADSERAAIDAAIASTAMKEDGT